MSSFYIDNYTEDTITVCIDASSAGWYFILIYNRNELIDTPTYYVNNLGKDEYLIENLSSGTEYDIEVRYSDSLDVDAATSLGFETVTTSGSGGSGGTTDPDEPSTDIVYITYVKYNANGGSGAPSMDSFESDTEYSTVTISEETPIRDGYEFLGWATDPDATTVKYRSGKTYSGWDAMDVEEGGYVVTLYAVWGQSGADTEGLVYINGNWYIPYIYTSDGWIPAKAHIYNSGWKVTITE